VLLEEVASLDRVYQAAIGRWRTRGEAAQHGA